MMGGWVVRVKGGMGRKDEESLQLEGQLIEKSMSLPCNKARRQIHTLELFSFKIQQGL